jgi:Leucine-rich repeat (LRR) protein
VTTLDFTGSIIPSPQLNTFRGLVALPSLTLIGNNLGTLVGSVFNGMVNLTYLTINNNGPLVVQSNAFQGLPNVTALDLSTCTITTLETNAFTGLDSLPALTLVGNGITRIKADAFNGMGSLVSLNLDNGATDMVLDAFAFRNLPQVLNLNFDGTDTLGHNLVANTFFGLSIIANLDLSFKQITSINTNAFAGLVTLTHLDLSGNLFNTLLSPFATLIGLTHLYMRDTSLTDFPVFHADLGTALEVLDLSGSLHAHLPDTKPFVNLGELLSLDLSRGQMYFIRHAHLFDGLASLQTLSLAHNLLTSFRARLFWPLTSLTSLNLANNSLVAYPLSANLVANNTLLTSLFCDNPDGWQCQPTLTNYSCLGENVSMSSSDIAELIACDQATCGVLVDPPNSYYNVSPPTSGHFGDEFNTFCLYRWTSGTYGATLDCVGDGLTNNNGWLGGLNCTFHNNPTICFSGWSTVTLEDGRTLAVEALFQEWLQSEKEGSSPAVGGTGRVPRIMDVDGKAHKILDIYRGVAEDNMAELDPSSVAPGVPDSPMAVTANHLVRMPNGTVSTAGNLAAAVGQRVSRLHVLVYHIVTEDWVFLASYGMGAESAAVNRKHHERRESYSSDHDSALQQLLRQAGASRATAGAKSTN